jgi:hypothetical protein
MKIFTLAAIFEWTKESYPHPPDGALICGTRTAIRALPILPYH